MIFFEAIGGLKYEEQTSAVLHYLFINSDSFRRGFVDLITNKLVSSTLIPTFNNGATCQLEVRNKDKDRLDILLESDNCILAIENKLWAAFTDNQPQKYESIAKDYAERKYKDNSRYLILVLAPEQRKQDVEEHLKSQTFDGEKPIFVSWSDVQTILRSLKGQSSTRVQIIGELLDEFIDHQTGKHATLNIAREKLIGPNAKVANPFQREFLYLIKSSFSELDPSRMGFGKETHAGFHFYLTPEKRCHFGFQQKWEVEDGTELRLQAHLDKAPTAPDDWKVKESSHFEGYYLFTYCPSDERWPTDRNAWQAAIESVIDAAKAAVVDKLTEPSQQDTDSEDTDDQ